MLVGIISEVFMSDLAPAVARALAAISVLHLLVIFSLSVHWKSDDANVIILKP